MSKEMQNRFDRIVAILTQLQSSRVLKAKDLADRFGVSLRTIYRDIRSLEVAGVPVSGEAGIGYSIMEGYRLPPVMFSREEASSFVAAEKLMQKFTDKKVRSHYESAMTKIKSVLRGNLKDHLDILEPHVWVTPVQELFEENSPDALEIILESIAIKKQVNINYRSFESEHPARRDIEPVGLFHEDQHWYIMAFCHLRNDYRQFRADRILHISRSDKPFTREHGPVDSYRKKDPAKPKVKVVIRVPKHIARYLQSGKKYYGLISEIPTGDHIEMTFMIPESGDALARWYMMFGDCAEIISPASFKQQVQAMAISILKSMNV